MRSVREGRTSSISGNGDRPRHRRGIHKIKKVREKARQRRALDLTWRVGVFMVGAAVIVAGLVMLITPGPGLLVIILGLAILASEYVWAQHLLERARAKARQAADKAFDPKRRRRNHPRDHRSARGGGRGALLAGVWLRVRAVARRRVILR